MDNLAIVEQIRSNRGLLSLPQALSELLEEVGKEDFSADSLATIILKDPSLTSRILQMANSSFYHRLSEITTVKQAVSILGVTTVKCLALSSSVLHPDKIAAESGVDPKAFFAYLLSIAASSEKIAKAVGYPSPEEAFIAGLLHDIGVLYFLNHHPEEYARITRREVHAATLSEAETQVFGIDHATVGYHVAETWRLPDYVLDSISGHHRLNDIKPGATLPNCVALAVLLTNDRFSGFELTLEERLSSITRVRESLGLSKEAVDEISSQTLAGTIEVAEYLGVDIGNIEDMLVKANQEIWKSYLTIENLFKERQELSRNLLEEERAKGAVESKNISLATLSHYLNNAIMAIYGRSQLLRMMLNKGNTERLLEKLPSQLEVMDRSTLKIVAVLEEMRAISPIDQKEYYHMSKAMNLDERIQARMEKMSEEDDWAGKVEAPPAS